MSSRLKFDLKPIYNKSKEFEKVQPSPIKGSDINEVVNSIKQNEIEKLNMKIEHLNQTDQMKHKVAEFDNLMNNLV